MTIHDPSSGSKSDIILERLFSLHPKIIDLSLDRMYEVLDALGNPEKQVPPVIHVAGTNGKGSTIAFLRAMLEAAGLSVHVYTSPHLVRFHERIRIGHKNGSDYISEEALTKALDHVEKVNAGKPITYFEITTATAFHVFATHPADVLLLEVGLGGRLDATNVIDEPLASVITPVSIDHVQFLGDTLGKIAFEKAGIIKENCPVIINRQEDVAEDVILEQARLKNASSFLYGMNWHTHTERGRMVYQDDTGLLDLPLPNLPGEHQISNAGAAIAALRAQTLFQIEDEAIEQGLKNAYWPGRMQRLSSGRWFDKLNHPASEIWLDGGHNPAAAKVLANTLDELGTAKPLPTILICGMINTKDATSFFNALSKSADKVYTVTIPNEAAAIPAEDLHLMATQAGLDTIAALSIDQAADSVFSNTDPIRVVFAGSLYFAGAVLRQN